MAVGLTFAVNLNDILKEILTKLQDAYDWGEDLPALVEECRYAMKRTQNLRAILTADYIPPKSVFSQMTKGQREQIVMLSNDSEELWQEFSKRVDQYRVTDKKAANVKRSLIWSTRGKRRAEIILKRIKDINQHAKDEIDTFIAWFSIRNDDVERVVESNADAQDVGLAQSIKLRRTWRDHSHFNQGLLKDAALFKPAQQSREAPFLYKSIFARHRHVLIEHRYYTEHDEQVKNYALRLATFLNLDKPDNMKVLRCIATYHEEDSHSYGFVFDSTPFHPHDIDASETSKTPNKLFLPTLTNLRSQLSKRDVTALFRYSRFGGDPSFVESPNVYLTRDQRVSFALSISQTVYQVLLVDWVHQDIRADNIWFTIDDDNLAILQDPSLELRQRLPRDPYLCNFQFARSSELYSDPNLALPGSVPRNVVNLARHPSRQLGKFLVPHGKIHDIYALGIVLLEIGLGRPIEELFQVFEKMNLPEFQSATADSTTAEPLDAFAETRRRRIIIGAIALLPERMGQRFTTIVVSCLTSRFASDSNDDVEDLECGISVLRQFRRAVIEELLCLAEVSP